MLPKKKPSCSGFTLLEVLLVVVISVSVMMFAVPSFKKAQARAQYMEATGVLIELANATKMMIEENPNLVISSASFNQNYTSGAIPPTISSSNAVTWMQGKKYLSQVNFQSSRYKGYNFAFSTKGTASCGSACAKEDAIACMANTSQIINAYKCAWISRLDGSLHNLEK